MSSAAYTAHLSSALLPSLAAAREALARVDADIADYEQVARRLGREKEGSRGPAPAELGAGVWVDVVVPSTATVTLDLGLDIHMPLPAPAAAAYAAKRAAVLRQRRAALEQREERLRWEVAQFEGAIREADEREAKEAAGQGVQVGEVD